MRISSLTNQPKIYQKQPSFKAIRNITLRQTDDLQRYRYANIDIYTKDILVALKAIQDSPAIQKLKARKEEYDLFVNMHDDEKGLSIIPKYISTTELVIEPVKPTEKDSCKKISSSVIDIYDSDTARDRSTQTFATYISNCQNINEGWTCIEKNCLGEVKKEEIKSRIDSIVDSLKS